MWLHKRADSPASLPCLRCIQWSIGKENFYLSKFYPDGNLLWVRTWGGSDLDYGVDVHTDSQVYIFFTGYFKGKVDFDTSGRVEYRTADQDFAYFLMKLHPDGY